MSKVFNLFANISGPYKKFSNLIFALKQDPGPTRLKVDTVKLQKLSFLSH